MNKLILLVPVSMLAVACTGGGFAITDDGGNVHYTAHHSTDYKGTAHFPATRTATGRKTFVFDPKATAWAAYDASGKRVKTGRASGGKDFCEDVGRPCRTVTGNYRIYSKKGADCKSSKYPIETGGGARMPHCMHFHGGYSIHGAYDVPNYNASHGCIRVLPSAAQWLNQEFADVGTKVEVRSY